MNPLRVNTADLRRLGDQAGELSDALGTASSTAPAGSAASWQSSVSEVAAARAGATADRTALAARMRSTAERITAASSTYMNTDAAAASKLTVQVV